MLTMKKISIRKISVQKFYKKPGEDYACNETGKNSMRMRHFFFYYSNEFITSVVV